MRITSPIFKIFFLTILLIPGGCGEKIPEDPCRKTQWSQPKEFEIRLAVKVSSSNPLLPGGGVGSQKPEDFEKMTVSGTIEKVECDKSASEPVNLGNTYIDKRTDPPAIIDVPMAYWVGHVVYVYEFNNDLDYLDLNFTVKITMTDGQSYMCNMPVKVNSDLIELVPGEMYYFILFDIYSDLWFKV